MKKYKYDIYAILFVIAISAIIFLINILRSENSEGQVLVEVDGTILNYYSLDQEGEYLINSKEGNCILCINDQEVYVKNATCKDGLCMKQGKISKTNQSIICLPNRMVISIKNSNMEDEYDAIAY